jgi:GH24 family phage-related lysozyme (muramidase)
MSQWQGMDGEAYRDDLGFLEKWTACDGTSRWRRVDLLAGVDPKAVEVEARAEDRRARGFYPYPE